MLDMKKTSNLVRYLRITNSFSKIKNRNSLGLDNLELYTQIPSFLVVIWN